MPNPKFIEELNEIHLKIEDTEVTLKDLKSREKELKKEIAKKHNHVGSLVLVSSFSKKDIAKVQKFIRERQIQIKETSSRLKINISCKVNLAKSYCYSITKNKLNNLKNNIKIILSGVKSVATKTVEKMSHAIDIGMAAVDNATNDLDLKTKLVVTKLEGKALDVEYKIIDTTGRLKNGVVQKVSAVKGFVILVPKKVAKKVKESLTNIDLKAKSIATMVEGKALDAEYRIIDAAGRLKNGVTQKVNIMKSYVTAVSKSVAKKVKNQYNKVAAVVESVKENVSNKAIETNEKVIEKTNTVRGNVQQGMITFTNRAINFKDNIAMKIPTKESIVTVSNSVKDEIKSTIQETADMFKSSPETRTAMASEIEKRKLENQKKKEQIIYKVKVKKISGFALNGTLIVMGILMLTAIIFVVVGKMIK